MAKVYYPGFSTQAWLDTRKRFATSGVETVKRDLLNHIYTFPGERVGLPEFGTRIPRLAFEQNDDITVKIIEEDLRKVFAYDPRVKLIELAVVPVPDLNAIVALADLFYVELDKTDTLRLEFKNNT